MEPLGPSSKPIASATNAASCRQTPPCSGQAEYSLPAKGTFCYNPRLAAVCMPRLYGPIEYMSAERGLES